jgi:hypothetical protein
MISMGSPEFKPSRQERFELRLSAPFSLNLGLNVLLEEWLWLM